MRMRKIGVDHNIPHVVLKEQEMTPSGLKTSLTNLKGQMIKDVVWKVFTQTSLKAINPRPGDS